MRHALTQQYGLSTSEWAFVYKKGSAPCISNIPDGTYCSLTHSNGIICFVTSPFPIGIDIENTSKKRNFVELANRFMNEREIEQFNKCKKEDLAKYFYSTWCAKEALYKATDTPLATQPKNSVILQYLQSSLYWHLLEVNLSEFLVTIVTREKPLCIVNNWLPS